MKRVIEAGCLILLLQGGALAATKKGMRFWNLTGETLSEVALAPAGTTDFGANQCANDKDGTVDFDEDVVVKGVKPGRYDIRMKDVSGRVCYAKSVDVKADATFSVHQKELVDCAK